MFYSPDGQLPWSPVQSEPSSRGQLQAAATLIRSSYIRPNYFQESEIQKDQTPLLQVGLGWTQESRK